MIDSAGACYFPYGGSAFSLEQRANYLENQPGKFEWVASRNGETVPGSVKYSGIPVGRVSYLGTMHVGKVWEPHQRMYFSHGSSENKAFDYEVLVFKPHVSMNFAESI